MERFLKRIRFLAKFHKSIPFIKDFFVSGQVKLSTKLLYAISIIGYIIFPFDLIPDFLFVFGIFDDVTVAIFLLQRMVKSAPEALKEKHELVD